MLKTTIDRIKRNGTLIRKLLFPLCTAIIILNQKKLVNKLSCQLCIIIPEKKFISVFFPHKQKIFYGWKHQLHVHHRELRGAKVTISLVSYQFLHQSSTFEHASLSCKLMMMGPSQKFFLMMQDNNIIEKKSYDGSEITF